MNILRAENSSKHEDQDAEVEVMLDVFKCIHYVCFFLGGGVDMQRLFNPCVVDGSLSGMCAVISSPTGFKSVGLFQH